MLVSELCRFDNQSILVSTTTKGSFTTREKDKAEFDLFATPSKILINTLFVFYHLFMRRVKCWARNGK